MKSTGLFALVFIISACSGVHAQSAPALAALTTKPAAAIAEAAQRWGQEDDITVLSITRAAMMAAVIA